MLATLLGNLWLLWFVGALALGGLLQWRDEWRIRRTRASARSTNDGRR